MSFIPQLLNYLSLRLNEDHHHHRRHNTDTRFDIQQLENRQLFAADLPGFDVNEGVLYQIHGTDGDQGQLSTIDLVNDQYQDIGDNAGFKINAAGFNVNDGLIYGMVRPSNELVAIGADGSHEVLGAVEGLPNGNYYTGDFGDDGLLYVRHNNNFYGINVDTVSVERTVSADSNVKKIYDIALNPEDGLHYAIRKNGNKADFISIDLREGPNEGKVTVINNDLRPAGTYGAMFADSTGRVFAANNKGGFYEIDVETGEATFAGYSPRASTNDGAFSSAASVNLPAVTFNEWFSTLAGTGPTAMNLTAPYDLDGDALTITVSELPTEGEIQLSDGSTVTLGQQLTIADFEGLHYDATNATNSGADTGSFVYEVQDGTTSMEGRADINVAGFSRISGQVSVNDDTEDGVYAGYEYNVTINLTGTDFQGNNVDLSTTTDVNGNFVFDDITPGNYQLTQIQPDGVYDSHTTSTHDGAVYSENTISNIVIPHTACEHDGFVFHEDAPGSVSGFVYADNNASDQVDVEEDGISNVTVNLTGTDVDGNSVSLSTITDSFGFYEFTDLRSGNYTVSQAQPDGFINAVENPGLEGGIASENQISDVDVFAGQVLQQYNFGEYEKSSLNGFVFVDHDKDSNFDAGDVAIEGVTVTLTGTDFRGNEVSRVTQSDAEGFYEFDDLLAGTYELRQTQPGDASFVSGKSHVGTFDGDEGVLDGNGVRNGSEEIVNINVDHGRTGNGYNFSERIHYELASEFEEVKYFQGTDGNDIIIFTPGEDYHTVSINGAYQTIDAGYITDIRIDGMEGHDTIRIYGTEKVEQAHMTGDVAILKSELFKVHAHNGEKVKVYSGGGYDVAYMHDTELDDRGKFTQDYSRIWNSEVRYESRGFHRSYISSINGGEDRAYLYDSKYDDTVKIAENSARMISRKFYTNAKRFEKVYAYANNGGNDKAIFWDSTADNDVFQTSPEWARMYNSGTGMQNVAIYFDEVEARATKGGENDRAYLWGTEGDDILVSSPRKTGLVGDGYDSAAKHFERFYISGNGGEDRAYLFDSKLDDRFVATPDNARLFNDEYYIKAKNFDQVDAFSSKGGRDRAYFRDSAGDDTLISLENEVRMFGDGFDNISHGFARNYAHSTEGGNDTAYIYDTDGADTFIVQGNVSKMYGPGYYNWHNSFEMAESRFATANRHDRALIFGAIGDNTIDAISDDLAAIINDHAAFYVYDVDAYEDTGEGDDDEISSIADDLFEIIPEHV